MAKNSKRKSSIPNPALKIFEKLIGKWELKGRTLDSKEDNITGWTTFEWMPRGFFLKSEGEINFKGSVMRSLEIIATTQRKKLFMQVSMQACLAMSFHTNGIFGATQLYIRD